jgi:hypothetical protein
MVGMKRHIGALNQRNDGIVNSWVTRDSDQAGIEPEANAFTETSGHSRAEPCLTQMGMATVRTRQPLPSKSGSTHPPSHCQIARRRDRGAVHCFVISIVLSSGIRSINLL